MKTYNLSTYTISIIFFAVILAFSLAVIPVLADDEVNDADDTIESTINLEDEADDVINDIGDIDDYLDDYINDDENNDTDDDANDDIDEDVEDANDLDEEEEKNKKEKNHRKRGDEHRSAIAELVEELRITADKAGDAGEEVREVAREQGDSKERVAEVIDNIEKRGKFKTFLIGTDYKNIGALRSELVTTENQINRLEKAVERIVVEDAKAELNAEIETLNEAKSATESFIQENEDKFSLFGWFVRLLN
ncbi:hypothetical protein ACFL22_00465 [Patescibacteria group bacterium]